MSDDSLKNPPPPRKMTRCPDGHVFDAAANDRCPSCGARVEAASEKAHQDRGLRPDRPPIPVPRPRWLRPALIAGGAIFSLLIIVILLRGAPDQGSGDAIVLTPGDQRSVADASVPEEAPAPAGVQRWQTVMLIGGRSYVCVNETQPDGRYRLGEGCPAPFAGETGVTTVAADGSWTSRSDGGRTDSGTIEFVNEDRFIAHTRGGPVIWDRVKP